jgi:hypothetical protein
VWLADSVVAQKYLTLQSAQDRRDEYNVILSKVFKRIYGDDVVLSVVCVPSFVPENAAGILKTALGYEVFSITPSASTWQTEYHRFFKTTDANGKQIPLPWHPAENIKEGLPINYRGIKTRVQSKRVSADLAERIKQVWQAKLFQALNPPHGGDGSERFIVTDGVRYQYSIPLQGHGLVTAQGRLVLKNTPVWLMGELSEVLSAYAQGQASENDVKEVLRRVETKKS